MQNISDPGIREILNGRRVATLATVNKDQTIHLTAVWYLFDGGAIVIGTSSGSRKARNAAVRSNASLLVDVRRPGHERGVSIAGSVEVIRGAQARA